MAGASHPVGVSDADGLKPLIRGHQVLGPQKGMDMVARRIVVAVVIACVAGALVFGAVHRTIAIAGRHDGGGAAYRTISTNGNVTADTSEARGTRERRGQASRGVQETGSK
jgi:hypothetical protein